MTSSHRRSLQALARRHRLRELATARGLDFSSNDYLGLAQSDVLKQAAIDALARGVPLGSGGSRLLRGNHPEHTALEAEAATWFGSEAALFMGGGFIANSALFATLPERGDLIVHDALIHASAIDGMAASRAANAAFAHNDVTAADDVIRAWRERGGKGRPWIAVESLYSMDGDMAPLADLFAVACRHDAMLVIDEAHATGALGVDGRGLGVALEGRDNVIALHTCGKALGVMGALITLPAVMRDYMVNRARAFIYATAPSPVVAATVRAALQYVASEPARREALAAIVTHTQSRIGELGGRATTGTHIQPIIVGSDDRAVHLAAALQDAGYDIRAVRPPTVPAGTARLRISLTTNVTIEDVDRMIATLRDALDESGL
ncbi:MAG: 8-amino-7-oxononanoate synthase [Hyphomicrobiaceae bacterium]|nr:8-amino-7-oxononanoate synthase [Hyphomicrobiaceae bacterium]